MTVLSDSGRPERSAPSRTLQVAASGRELSADEFVARVTDATSARRLRAAVGALAAIRLQVTFGPDLRLVRRERVLAYATRLSTSLYAADAYTLLPTGEILVLLVDIADPSEVGGICRRLLSVAQDQPLNGEAQAEANLGCTILGGMHLDPQEAIDEALLALSRAEQSGGDGMVIFGEQDRLQIFRHFEAISAIRLGIAASTFEMHYQPVVSVASGSVESFEALLRAPAIRVAGTALTPSQIVSLAEESHLIGVLGEWVLRQVSADAVEWAALGISTAVNLSPRQLEAPFAAERLLAVVADCGMRAQDVTFEITETSAHTGVVLRGLHTLSEAGHAIALDDFGIGYSALASLRELPIDILKLDRSLLVEAIAGNRGRRLMGAVLEIADAFDLVSVGEGVEGPTELALLKELGCQRAQGFFTGRPMPAALAVRVLGAHHNLQDVV